MKTKESAQGYTSLDELQAILKDRQDVVDAEFPIPGTESTFKCQLKVFTDADEYIKVQTQVSERMKRTNSKNGYAFKLPGGEDDKITSDTMVCMMTYVEFGMVEPKMSFGELAALRKTTGPLISRLGMKIVELNEPGAVESAKNESRQEDGPETPVLPASESPAEP